MDRPCLLFIEQEDSCIQDFAFLSRILEGITKKLETAMNAFLFFKGLANIPDTCSSRAHPLRICSCLCKELLKRQARN